MIWKNIQSLENLESLIEDSYKVPQLIFKHSTRCSISSMVKNRLESKWGFTTDKVNPFYLDLISYRELSNEIAKRYSVTHESPQILLIKNGICVFNASHTDINVADIEQQLLSF